MLCQSTSRSRRKGGEEQESSERASAFFTKLDQAILAALNLNFIQHQRSGDDTIRKLPQSEVVS